MPWTALFHFPPNVFHLPCKGSSISYRLLASSRHLQASIGVKYELVRNFSIYLQQTSYAVDCVISLSAECISPPLQRILHQLSAIGFLAAPPGVNRRQIRARAKLLYIPSADELCRGLRYFTFRRMYFTSPAKDPPSAIGYWLPRGTSRRQ